MQHSGMCGPCTAAGWADELPSARLFPACRSYIEFHCPAGREVPGMYHTSTGGDLWCCTHPRCVQRPAGRRSFASRVLPDSASPRSIREATSGAKLGVQTLEADNSAPTDLAAVPAPAPPLKPHQPHAATSPAWPIRRQSPHMLPSAAGHHPSVHSTGTGLLPRHQAHKLIVHSAAHAHTVVQSLPPLVRHTHETVDGVLLELVEQAPHVAGSAIHLNAAEVQLPLLDQQPAIGHETANGSRGHQQEAPVLLFLHGAKHGAWCWEVSCALCCPRE